MTRNIMVVEDEAVIAMDLQDRLEKLGYAVPVVAETGAEAIRQAELHNPDLVLMDIRLKGEMDGSEAAEQIHGRLGLPVIFLTAFSDEQTLLKARGSEPLGYLHKPCHDRELRTAIEMGLYRHRAERQLRESEQLHAAMLRSIGDAIIAVDAGGWIVLMNPVAERLTGWTQAEAVGQPIEAVFAPRDQQTRQLLANPVRQALGDNQVVALSRSALLLTRDGREVPIDDSAAPIRDEQKPGNRGAVVAFRDISQRKEAEAQLRYAQKLESLGVLSGGIAHDFNNLLTPILGFASLARTILPPASPAIPMLEQVEQAANRAAALTQQMLAYSGKGRILLEPIDLSVLVREMTALLSASISKKAVLHFQLADPLPPIDGDRSQIRQVVMNLITNASDALGELPGNVHIRTGTLFADRDYLRSPYFTEELPEGEYVSVAVVDSGCGMSPETLARIFDPFFTTKFLGRGLGLAAVQGIVRGHKATLKVRTEPGRGSTFEVLFPRSHASVAPAPPAAAPAPAASGTVLVVEDEEPIRRVAQHVLESNGFRVLLAVDGQQAVDQFREHAAAIDAVLLDLTMPKKNGLEVLVELRQLRPEVRVVLMSGYSQEDIAQRFAGQQLAGFVQKPFNPLRLLAALQRAVKG